MALCRITRYSTTRLRRSDNLRVASVARVHGVKVYMKISRVIVISLLSMLLAWVAVSVQFLLQGKPLSFVVQSSPISLLIYFLPPALVICASELVVKHPLPSLVYILVPIAWLGVIFLAWAYKPWVSYGQFPWWGFYRHFIGVLAPFLVLGLSFLWLRKRATP